MPFTNGSNELGPSDGNGETGHSAQEYPTERAGTLRIAARAGSDPRMTVEAEERSSSVGQVSE